MSAKVKKIIALSLFLGIAAVGVRIHISYPEKTPFDSNSITSYREIPGVTYNEINAIEELKNSKKSFSFGTAPTTEAFILPNGTFAGFAPMFCELLSGLFGLPFVHEFYSRDTLESALVSGTIDFSCDLIPTPEQMSRYFMTHPIAGRSLGIFTCGMADEIQSEPDLEGLKIGFLDGTGIEKAVSRVYPAIRLDSVLIKDIRTVPGMLEAGIIDAFIIEEAEAYAFDNNIFCKRVLPLIYTSVSMAAIDPDLEPVISVVNKYIEAGGYDKIYKLYREGSLEYARFDFRRSLNEKERAYIDDLAAKNSKIPIALEHDNYPMSFYNDKDNDFQGIAPQILAEISSLTGIRFDVATDSKTPWTIMFDKLKTGELALVSELLYSDERKDNFLWSNRYASSHYALLSKSDYPQMEISQIHRAMVGIGRLSAYEEMFRRFFPDNSNVIYYDSQEDALNALENGKIDLLMASENVLLTLRNYREKPGYKVNVRFTAPMEESYFGFNINEEVLCGIFRKAQVYINTGEIEEDWTSRIFDYSRKMADERSRYLSMSSVVLLFLLLVLILLFIKNIQVRESYKNRMLTLSTIYKSLPDLVYSKDQRGAYTSCNKSFEEFVGACESDIIGKNPSEVYTADVIMSYKLMAMDRKVMRDNSVIKAEEWLVNPDKTRMLFEIVKVPLIQDGKAVGLLGINRDVTKYKEAEKAAQEASRAKSSFLAKMSHEIRTPMNAIIGMAELALREDELDVAHRHIMTVKQAGAHLLSIINDILDFSKIEMGKLEIITGTYSFSSLVNDVVSIIRMRLMDSEVKFAVNIDCNIPNMLVGDETRMRQVLLNILSNAVKYTEKGFISFIVNGKRIDNTTIQLTMKVMDSGKGIKQIDMNKLFGDYVQFDLEKNKGIEGVGLGLAITWSIVKTMGGDIEVDSEYGKGSVFTVTIPQEIHSDEVLASVEKPEEKNVIVYECHAIYANSIMSTIDNFGVKCTLVSDDSEFLEKIKNDTYDFMFISYSLLKNNREIISKYGKNVKITVLSDFGEAIPDKELNVLPMPVYSITIANILNGISENFSFSDNNEAIVRFNAPAARILVVDDIYTNLKVAEGLMLPYKMRIDLAGGGREAIQAVKNIRYDLVFMDHKMPGMDGIEAARHIRALDDEDPYYRNLPIIVLTANAVSGTREMFLQNGFDDFLSKPIDTIKLNTILEKWIPKEKQTIPAEEDNKPVTAAGADIPFQITGVDVKKGIQLSGGTIDRFLDTLAIYHKDGLKKIEEITASLESKDLHLYTIYVHAMKSASANIGAAELSEEAYALETAGERNDLVFIEEHNNEFLMNLRALLRIINEKLSREKQDVTAAKNIPDPVLFRAELAALRMALNSLDAGTINNSIENLKEISYGTDADAVMESLSEKVLLGEYDDAIKTIDTLLD